MKKVEKKKSGKKAEKKTKNRKSYLTSGHKLHRDGQVLRGQEDLLELHHVRVHEHAVVEDFALDIFRDLFFDFLFIFKILSFSLPFSGLEESRKSIKKTPLSPCPLAR